MPGIGLLIGILIRIALDLMKRRGIDTRLHAVSRFWYWAAACVRCILAYFAALSWREHEPGLAGLLLLAAWPEPVLRLLLIPAGVPFVPQLFTHVFRPQAVLGEVSGGAVLNELRARSSWGFAFATARCARLERKLFKSNRRRNDAGMRGATLTARAVLDVLGGDCERARQLFAVAQDMYRWHATRSVRCYAQSWLLVDAARRGAYHELARLSQHGPLSARRFFLAGVARKLLSRSDAPGRFALMFWWLASPGRLAGLELLRLALRAQPRELIAVSGPELGPVRTATIALLRLPRGAVSRSELRLVARAWQALFESHGLGELLAQRRDAVQASFEVGSVVLRLDQEVVKLLADLWRDSLADGAEDTDEPQLILAAKDLLQSDLLSELEDICSDLPHGKAKSSDEFEQHWRNWSRARAIAQLFLDILPDRRSMIFDTAGLQMLNHGAWLYNTERARFVAHDVFRFLTPLAAHDSENQRITRKNMMLSR